MKNKITFLILGTIFLLLFIGCKQTTINNTNSTQVTLPTSQQSNSAEIVWKNYDKKFDTLAGIKYPENFIADDSNGLEIRSTATPLIINNKCYFTAPCSENGLLIVIGHTKMITGSRLESTKFANIRSVKVNNDNQAVGSQKDVKYQEYLFISKNQDLPYLIQIYSKGFNGNSEQIIDGILGTLHE
jgi:hypothetical protein